MEADWIVQNTLIKRGASIGSGTALLGGITVGEKAIVGAGQRGHNGGFSWHHRGGNPARMLKRL